MTVKKVTQEQIDSIVAQASFEVMHRIHGKQCIVVAKLPNGFTVVGESACVDPTNYDEQIGFDLAVKQIKNRLWELEGYVLQSKLHLEGLAIEFAEQVKLGDYHDNYGHKLKMNKPYQDLMGALLLGQQDGYWARLREGEAVLTASQIQILNEANTLLRCSPSVLQHGHIRLTSNTYIGDCSKDISIEGAVDDVLKIAESSEGSTGIAVEQLGRRLEEIVKKTISELLDEECCNRS